MKNRSLWIAFFVGVAVVFGFEVVKTTTADTSHESFMKEYCAKTLNEIQLCKRYAN